MCFGWEACAALDVRTPTMERVIAFLLGARLIHRVRRFKADGECGPDGRHVVTRELLYIAAGDR